MRILIFHGYLLRGTGSNVYNASLAPALAALGHDVHLLCQDRGAGELAWVDAVGDWDSGEMVVRSVGGAAADDEPTTGPSAPADGPSAAADGPADGTGQSAAGERPDPGESPARGRITVYVPDIGGLLPVYVHDEYPGFEVKEFRDLSEAELDRYLAANVSAVREVTERAGGIEAALANHLVMGPAVLSRAGLRFAAKVHGSALEYTVKRDPERFLPFAREGLDAAAGVLAGSRHTAESLWAALGDDAVRAKTRLGPPGVDMTLFAPLERSLAPKRLHAFAARLAPGGGAGAEGGGDARTGDPGCDSAQAEAGDPGRDPTQAAAGAWGRDPPRAAAAIGDWAAAAGDRVIFVGKLIVNKGVDLLLVGWPLVHAAKPGSRLLIVGFGEYRTALERIWASIEAGEIGDLREIAAAGRELEGGERKPLRMLEAFLDALPQGYEDAARAASGSVAFAGRLEHEEVAAIVPAADALVFPSTFPEAFGMVAAEAAAAGVLPVSVAHSGALEVSRLLAGHLPPEVADLISFPLDDRSVLEIVERLRAWSLTGEAERSSVREALAATSASLFSWEGVARGAIEASAGRLAGLPEVPR